VSYDNRTEQSFIDVNYIVLSYRKYIYNYNMVVGRLPELAGASNPTKHLNYDGRCSPTDNSCEI